jgi:hypothetical protein
MGILVSQDDNRRKKNTYNTYRIVDQGSLGEARLMDATSTWRSAPRT